MVECVTGHDKMVECVTEHDNMMESTRRGRGGSVCGVCGVVAVGDAILP